ncbi:protein FAM32A-like [Oscarella lobularis]|uniref:protein FAM32A-like n=1 Tax=Oscarella lobularis TaxID=121494 RepID=UPI0033144B39
MADAYETVQKGSLKLKGVAAGGIQKKKKKSKRKREEIAQEAEEAASRTTKPASKPRDTRTPAQKAFDRVQEKRLAERALKKAEKSHKERVQEFNVHLDSLTEHFDIQKVSWTK